MTKHTFFHVFILLLTCQNLLQSQTFLTASLNSPGNSGVLAENCTGPYELVLRRGPDNDSLTEIFISGAGNATIGADYSFGALFPVIMEIEDSIAIIPIDVVNDGNTEGLETVQLEIAFLAGEDSDFITFETAIVDGYSVEIQAPNDTIVWCRDVPYVLLANSDAEEIFWSPAEFFDDSLGTAATVRPFESGWYYASVGTDACGAKDSIYFDLAIVEIANEDTVYICFEDPGVVLFGNIEGLATEFEWIPSDTSLINSQTLAPTAIPTVTTTYTLQSDIGVCVARDRVVVRVDSLPQDLHIDIAPLKPYYCAGEIVALFSPTFDSLLFPDIIFEWLTYDNTFLSDTGLLNAALELQDTILHIRENINNACSSRDSILINVVPPSVPLSVNDTLLCPGEMFTVTVLSDQVTEPEWMPTEGLSCSKCLDPKVTVIGAPGTIQSHQFSGKINECPVGASLSITIPPVKSINLSADNVVCEGETVPITIENPEGLSNFDWEIINGNGSLSCNDCPNPTLTVNSNNSITVVVTADEDDIGFCGASGSIQFLPGLVKQFTGPTFNACLGETVVVNTGDPTAFDIQWSVFQGNLDLSCTGCETPTVTVNGPFNQLRFLGETTDTNFCSVSGIVNVITFAEDVSTLVIVPDPNVSPIGQGSQVSVILDVVPPPATIMWTVNGVDISATGNSIEFNADEEINSVVARFTNSKGCEQVDTISFPTVPPSYMIPNAFTPNNDELNDNFRIIINGNITVEEFLVFNRWGQLVYEAPADDLEGWDGRFKNDPAASDTYVYSAKIRFPDGRIENAKGDVALLR